MSRDVKWLFTGVGAGLLIGLCGGITVGSILLVGSPVVWLFWRGLHSKHGGGY